MPQFSIIVPVYKVEPYIRKCVNSVLDQTFKDFELILVDDGSPDNCPVICDEYASIDPRVRVVHKSNGGLVSARKAGAMEAKGKYCVALDSDDWLAENCLERLLAIVDKYTPDIVRFGLIIANKDERKMNPYYNYKKGAFDRQQIESEIFPRLIYSKDSYSFPSSVCGTCIKTSLYVVEQLLVPDEIAIGEDFAVTKPIMVRASSFFFMDECLYYYRMNEKSMTKKRKPFSLRNYAIRYYHILNRVDVDKFCLREQLYRSTAHGLFTAYATQFYQNASFFKVRKQILASMKEEPYNEIINNVHFVKPFSRKVVGFVLKHRLITLIWLYSKIKK